MAKTEWPASIKVKIRPESNDNEPGQPVEAEAKFVRPGVYAANLNGKVHKFSLELIPTVRRRVTDITKSADRFVETQDERDKAAIEQARYDRKRLKDAAKLEPIDHQEKHDKTEDVLVTVMNTVDAKGKAKRKMKKSARRRKSDARIWEAIYEPPKPGAKSLGAEREWALERIGRGHSLLSGDIRVRGANFFVMETSYSGGAEITAAEYEELETDFHAWYQRCKTDGHAPSAVIDFIVDGLSMSAIDRKHKHRKGWALSNLISALDVFLDIKGITKSGKGD